MTWAGHITLLPYQFSRRTSKRISFDPRNPQPHRTIGENTKDRSDGIAPANFNRSFSWQDPTGGVASQGNGQRLAIGGDPSRQEVCGGLRPKERTASPSPYPPLEFRGTRCESLPFEATGFPVGRKRAGVKMAVHLEAKPRRGWRRPASLAVRPAPQGARPDLVDLGFGPLQVKVTPKRCCRAIEIFLREQRSVFDLPHAPTPATLRQILCNPPRTHGRPHVRVAHAR